MLSSEPPPHDHSLRKKLCRIQVLYNIIRPCSLFATCVSTWQIGSRILWCYIRTGFYRFFFIPFPPTSPPHPCCALPHCVLSPPSSCSPSNCCCPLWASPIIVTNSTCCTTLRPQISSCLPLATPGSGWEDAETDPARVPLITTGSHSGCCTSVPDCFHGHMLPRRTPPSAALVQGPQVRHLPTFT
jgi:hypothetical protein